MAEYDFLIGATAFMTLTVKASSREEAKQEARRMLNSGSFVIDNYQEFTIDDEAVLWEDFDDEDWHENEADYETFYTYPDCYYSDGYKLTDEEYDNNLCSFRVPKDWLDKWLSAEGFTLEEFRRVFTYDSTYIMFQEAKADGVIIDKRLEPR